MASNAANRALSPACEYMRFTRSAVWPRRSFRVAMSPFSSKHDRIVQIAGHFNASPDRRGRHKNPNLFVRRFQVSQRTASAFSESWHRDSEGKGVVSVCAGRTAFCGAALGSTFPPSYACRTARGTAPVTGTSASGFVVAAEQSLPEFLL